MSEIHLVQSSTLSSLFGVTERRIEQLVAEGVVVRVSRGKYDLFQSVKGYVQFLQSGQTSEELSRIKAEAETRSAVAKAEQDEIDAAIAKGTAHLASDVEDCMSAMIMNCRSRLLALPTKAAPAFQQCETLQDAVQVLEKEVHEALNELSDYRQTGLAKGVVPEAGETVEPAPEVEGERMGGQPPETQQ